MAGILKLHKQYWNSNCKSWVYDYDHGDLK